ncbi:DEAD/DEAH box helicase, partial [Nostoc sp. CHAB 5715]|uniref:DEAD/DEAH box helicase n=1 Tax=Nostoc sp. CHAB 5715 TaxID=2780400 RepID=UPI001E5E95AA
INEQQILDNLGIESLNAMQKSALKNITKENDVFLLSPTGSGKTLAFLSCQSKDFTWSANTTPETTKPSETR